EARNHVEQRGLSTAARSHKADEFPYVHLEAHILERMGLHNAIAKPLRHAINDQLGRPNLGEFVGDSAHARSSKSGIIGVRTVGVTALRDNSISRLTCAAQSIDPEGTGRAENPHSAPR